MEVFTIPETIAPYSFAVASQLPANIPYTKAITQPRTAVYLPILTPLISIPTSMSEVFNYTATNDFYIQYIAILPSSNASTNGAQGYMQVGTMNIGSSTQPFGIATITNITFNEAMYPELLKGQSITIYAGASASGSYVQFLIMLVYKNSVIT